MRHQLSLALPFFGGPQGLHSLHLDNSPKAPPRKAAILKPRLTLIETVISGSINGELSSTDPETPLTDATVSAQMNGVEVLSTRMRDDATYRLSPLLPGTYTLVVTASGFATVGQDNIAVTAGTDITDLDFALAPSDIGSISGTTLPGDETVEIHLVQDGNFIASTGADAVTGEFVFANVPVGTYDVVLRVSGVETDRAEAVVVAADADTSGLTLGLE